MQKFMSAIRSKSPMRVPVAQRPLEDLKKLSKAKSRVKSPMNQRMKLTFQDESELPNIQKKLAKNTLKTKKNKQRTQNYRKGVYQIQKVVETEKNSEESGATMSSASGTPFREKDFLKSMRKNFNISKEPRVLSDFDLFSSGSFSPRNGRNAGKTDKPKQDLSELISEEEIKQMRRKIMRDFSPVPF